MFMYNKINVLEKIGWYQDVESTSYDKLTDLFDCMVDYFKSNDKYFGTVVSDDIYVGGYYPMNPQLTFSNVIKRAYRYIDPTHKSIHLAYCAYCSFLNSPYAHSIATDTKLFINNTLESNLIDEFIRKTYG
jgi:hypothetical protein